MYIQIKSNNNVEFNYSSLLRDLSRSAIILIIIFTIFPNFTFAFSNSGVKSTSSRKWVGTWSTAQQLVEPGNNPPSPGLSNNTLRQIVRVSIGGDSLRIRFSNEFSTSPVTLNSVTVALSKGNGVIDPSSERKIYFGGKTDVIMSRNSAVTSDPFQFNLPPRTDIAITIYFGNTSPDVTGHPGSRTTSYILPGNEISKVDFSNAVKTDHWYVINTIDVLASDSAAAVAIIGNSITDGRGSGTNKQNRWPDELARRLHENLATQQVAVLNQGIGGNCVLRNCLGPSAISRLNRDVIKQSGVKWLIIFEGINDIGQAWGTQGAAKVAQDLIAAYSQMIDSARANGIIVYGATLMPFGGSSYDSPDRQNAWRTVNDWIRNSGRFDAVIDLEKTLRDPANPSRMLPIADTGDHLHPNETGHRMIAESVDLALFGDKISDVKNEKSDNVKGNFSLLQNYPNPFNPITKLKFALPQRSMTKLVIYDSLGREMQTMINKELEAGYHEINFNAGSLNSGVYFYRIYSGALTQTKKMILLR